MRRCDWHLEAGSAPSLAQHAAIHQRRAPSQRGVLLLRWILLRPSSRAAATAPLPNAAISRALTQPPRRSQLPLAPLPPAARHASLTSPGAPAYSHRRNFSLKWSPSSAWRRAQSPRRLASSRDGACSGGVVGRTSGVARVLTVAASVASASAVASVVHLLLRAPREWWTTQCHRSVDSRALG